MKNTNTSNIPKKTLKIKVGNKYYLACFDLQVKNVRWHSSDELIASVNKITGLISANSVGCANIYAEAENGDLQGYFNIFKIPFQKKR